MESRGGQICAWESVRVHTARAPRRAAGAVPLPGPRQRLGAVLQPYLLEETSGDCQAHTPPVSLSASRFKIAFSGFCDEVTYDLLQQGYRFLN